MNASPAGQLCLQSASHARLTWKRLSPVLFSLWSFLDHLRHLWCPWLCSLCPRLSDVSEVCPLPAVALICRDGTSEVRRKNKNTVFWAKLGRELLLHGPAVFECRCTSLCAMTFLMERSSKLIGSQFPSDVKLCSLTERVTHYSVFRRAQKKFRADFLQMSLISAPLFVFGGGIKMKKARCVKCWFWSCRSVKNKEAVTYLFSFSLFYWLKIKPLWAPAHAFAFDELFE